MKNFKLEADNIKDELKQIRRTLHQYPELGFEETNTSKYIKEFLTKEELNIQSLPKLEYVELSMEQRRVIIRL